jgi:RND family efflux transporter MFP subunit
MKKRWIVITILALLAAAAVFAAKNQANDKDKDKEESPFRLGAAQTEDLQVSVREVGVVDPEDKVDVKSTVSGRVVTLHVREGDVVRRGQVLAEVEPDVTQAQSLSNVKSDVTQAELKLKDTVRQLEAQQALFDNGLISSDTLRSFLVQRDLAAETLSAAKARYDIVEQHGIPISGKNPLSAARVVSPMDGVIIAKGVELGQTVTSGVSSFNEGTMLFTIADLKSLLIRVNLNEVDIAKIRVGQPVRVTLDAYPQRIFDGKVRFVAPAAKLQERIKVFPIEVAIDELDPSFHTGMSANVEILGEQRSKALSVPLEALQRRDGQVVVYRLKKNLSEDAIGKARDGLDGKSKFVWLSENWRDYFEPVTVKAGVATLERVEVMAGLSSGDQVSLEDPTRKKVEKDDENN